MTPAIFSWVLLALAIRDAGEPAERVKMLAFTVPQASTPVKIALPAAACPPGPVEGRA